MKRAIMLKKVFMIFILISFLVQISACGTLMYPERRGQNSGRVDVGIAVLDGVGLLFFLIPGIIAYAVDFSTGAIYLPGGGSSSISDVDEFNVVRISPAELNEKTIKRIVIRETGISETFDANNAKVWALNGTEDVSEAFAEIKKSRIIEGRKQL